MLVTDSLERLFLTPVPRIHPHNIVRQPAIIHRSHEDPELLCEDSFTNRRGDSADPAFDSAESANMEPPLHRHEREHQRERTNE
jgi:hypothetical protein